MKKILLVIFDGLSDRPISALGNKTPLEVAKIPNLNKLAKKGICGVQNALLEGEYPTSEEAHFSILGYDYKKEMPGRGVLEALGINAPVSKNDLVLRVDFGSVDVNLRVVDPRSGNIKSVVSFCDYVGEIKIKSFTFRLYPGLAHRAVLVVSGPAVSKEIHHHSTIVTDTDPHKSKNHRGGNKVLIPAPLNDSPEAKLTAEVLWEYQMMVHEKLDNYVENKVRERSGLLPANFVLTRGASFLVGSESFGDRFSLRAACVAGAPLYKGIGRCLGMDILEVAGATGGIDTDVSAKINKSLEALESGYNFVFLHFKATDVVAEEDGDWDKKIAFLERADEEFGKLLEFDGILAVTGDHSTPCILKDHSTDPVPFMMIGGAKDDVGAFNEIDCRHGLLGHFSGHEIMKKIIQEAESV